VIALAAAYFGFAPARDTDHAGVVAPMHDTAVTH
jgi:hypothetical protein